jgi:hypothetical protein
MSPLWAVGCRAIEHPIIFKDTNATRGADFSTEPGAIPELDVCM